MMIGNYDGENMLIGASKLNKDIKDYLNSPRRRSDDGYIETLKEYREDINEYIADIVSYNFAPRVDGLSKEGILIDLETNLRRINKRLISPGRVRYVRSRRSNVIASGKRKKRSRRSKRGSRSRKA